MPTELPCQPQTQVTVCSRCLYSSITCLNSGVIPGLAGGVRANAGSDRSLGAWACRERLDRLGRTNDDTPLTRPLPPGWVDSVAQGVAQEIDAKHEQDQDRGRLDGEPPGA